MSEGKKRSLEERLQGNPVLRKRLESMMDIAENVNGEFETADEAEERAGVTLGSSHEAGDLLLDCAIRARILKSKSLQELLLHADRQMLHARSIRTGSRAQVVQ